MIDIKLVTLEYPKTPRKLSKTIRQDKRVLQVGGADENCTSSLYSKTTKTDFFMKQRL